MNSDLNKNGLIDLLEQQIQHASTSTISNFATVAKKASELRDGANKCYFNKVNKCLVIKHGNKTMTECLQFNGKSNDINNVNSIHFMDESTLSGVVSNFQTSLTDDEKRMLVPSMSLIDSIIDPTFEAFAGNFNELNEKTKDISYNENSETTTIAHDLSINGNINCNWLDNEFAKYALVGHNHDSTYALINHNHNSTYALIGHNHDSRYSQLNHLHEFDDIYKQTTRMIINENTNEEEEIIETKTLQQVLTEYEQSMTTAINGKANSSHNHAISDINNLQTTLDGKANSSHNHAISDINNLQTTLDGKANSSHNHEIGNVYKSITVQNQDGTTTTTTKTLDAYIIEREDVIKALINGKANSNHGHNATEIIYKPAEGNNAAVNVKQQLDTIMNKLEVVDSQGRSLDILKILFGADAIVGGAIDGGLAYAVASLQGQIATLQSQIVGEGLADDAFEAFDEVGDVVGGSSNLTSSLSSWANCFSRIRASLRGYQQVATITANPLAGAVLL